MLILWVEIPILSKKDFNELLQRPLINQIPYADVAAMVRSGAVLVDIRMENKYRNSGHFRGCINIPLYLLRLKIGTLDPAKKYIMYCDTGHRSSAAAFIMNEHGLEAYVLEGGLAALSRGEDSREG